MLKISIHGTIPIEQTSISSQLTQLVIDCGGWILEQKMFSGAAFCLRFEADLSNFSKIYAALQRSGMQFTPAAHRAMAQMCFCEKHLSLSGETQIVSIDLHVAASEEEATHLRSSPRQQSA